MNNMLLFGAIAIIAIIAGIYFLMGQNSSSPTSNPERASAPSPTMDEMKKDDMENNADSMNDSMNDTMADKPKSNTIVDKAIELEMTTLVEAVTAAGLVETLSSPGPFTVFVPTQQAFDEIAPTLETIMSAPNAKEQLAQILTYHVVSGEVPAADVVNLTKATTVEGSDVAITVANGTVKVNDATVIQTDVKVDNGIIHVIDKVLIPHTN